jgi:hypothetical protein
MIARLWHGGRGPETMMPTGPSCGTAPYQTIGARPATEGCEDREYLLEFEPTVQHYEVTDSDTIPQDP